MAEFTQHNDTSKTAANRQSVANHVQAKLKVGQPGDRYEQEADHAAERVVGQQENTPSSAASLSPASHGVSIANNVSRISKSDFGQPQTKLQRQEEEEAQTKVQRQEEEEEAQAKVQRQEEEEEAQAKVQRQEEEEEAQAKVQRQEEEEEAQAKVQRQEEEEEAQAKVQRQEEEEEAQAKVQRQEEEEEAQAKVQRQEEEEEAQTKVQRQEEEEEAQAKVQRQEEEEEAQAKVQRQEEEEEAQTKVQRQEEEEEAQAKVQRQEEEEEAQTKVQRQEEEEEAQAKTDVKSNLRDKRKYPVLNSVEPKIQRTKGGGAPMEEDVRREMEVQFGADFRKVRIHTDAAAVDMAREMEAQAFTTGNDIYFNEGKYDPDSLFGRTLLAHELTHVIQQGKAVAKVPDSKIADSNTSRNQPGAQPADAAAKEVSEKNEEQQKEFEEQELEKPEEVKQTLIAEDNLKADPKAEQKAKKKPKTGKKKKGGKKEKEEKGPVSLVKDFLIKTSEAKVAQQKSKLTKLAKNETTKDDASTKLAKTEKAVVPPAEEGQSKANASQVETVDQSEEPKPDEAKAKEEMTKAMEAAIPKSLEEADQFKEEGKGRVVGEQVKSAVTADTQEVQTTYQEIENTPDPEPAPPSEELPEIEAAPETPAIGLGDDVIGEVQPEHTDLSEFEAQTDEKMSEEGISEEQLDMVDSGPLAEAKEGRKQQKEKVKSGPEEVKQVEKDQKKKVHSEMKKEEQAGKQQMKEERRQKLQNTQDKQKKTKQTLEEKRQAVTEKINGIYESTNTAVNKKLEALEQQSLKAFDDGQQKATQTFEDNVKRRLDAFKDDRYSGMFGWARWLKDKLLGMDDLPEVKRIFDSERATFISNIDALITKITADNKKVIVECKKMVQEAREKIAAFVDNLGPELRSAGQQAQSDMQSKLDALDETVNKKEEELKKKLDEKREAAIKAIDEKIEKMKAEMSGLAGKLGALLLNALIKLFRWAVEKIGGNSDVLMEKLDKGIKKIVKSPGKFLSNLGKAVELGMNQFKNNFTKHLMSGLVEWLTGAMSGTGLKMPDKFDLKGVMSLGLQIMGLTWEALKVRLVKVGKIPAKMVDMAEKGLDIILQIKEKGLIVLWDMLKEKAEDLKNQVIESISKWAVTQIIKSTITKLLLMLNPAGALLQLAMTIYDAVMWFIENIQRIIDFIMSIFNGILEIASGQIAKAAGFIENALAKMVPILLSFLARWLKLSGVGKAIKNVIKKVRKPIDKVVNKIVKFLAKKIRKLFKKGKKGVVKAKDAAKAGLKKLLGWWKNGKHSFKNKANEKHTIKLADKGGKPQTKIASENFGPFKQKITDYMNDDNTPKSEKPHLKKAITEVGKLEKAIENKSSELKKKKKKKGTTNKQSLTKSILKPSFSKIAKHLSNTNFTDNPGKMIPPSRVVWTTNGNRASKVTADPLSKIPGNTQASPPGGTMIPGWDYIKEINEKGIPATNTWVRLHLLHGPDGGQGPLHGPGKKWNLTPGTKETNRKKMFFQVERDVVNFVNEGRVFKYETKVSYGHSGGPTNPANSKFTDAFKNFPSSIEMSYRELDYDATKKAWYAKKGSDAKKDKKSFGNLELPVNLDEIPLKIKQMSASDINQNLSLNAVFAKALFEVLEDNASITGSSQVTEAVIDPKITTARDKAKIKGWISMLKSIDAKGAIDWT